MDNKLWQDFFKKRGRFYLEIHPDIPKIVQKLKLYNVKKVIDLGCGSGRHSVYLAKNGFLVHGVDFSDEALELARKWSNSEGLNTKFTKENIHEKLSFENGVFDACIAVDSLHYSSTDGLRFSIQEINRILKPHGFLFLTLPTISSNKLISHLIFSEKKIKSFLKDTFTILESFYDNQKFYCVLAIKK